MPDRLHIVIDPLPHLAGTQSLETGLATVLQNHANLLAKATQARLPRGRLMPAETVCNRAGFGIGPLIQIFVIGLDALTRFAQTNWCWFIEHRLKLGADGFPIFFSRLYSLAGRFQERNPHLYRLDWQDPVVYVAGE